MFYPLIYLWWLHLKTTSQAVEAIHGKASCLKRLKAGRQRAGLGKPRFKQGDGPALLQIPFSCSSSSYMDSSYGRGATKHHTEPCIYTLALHTCRSLADFSLFGWLYLLQGGVTIHLFFSQATNHQVEVMKLPNMGSCSFFCGRYGYILNWRCQIMVILRRLGLPRSPNKWHQASIPERKVLFSGGSIPKHHIPKGFCVTNTGGLNDSVWRLRWGISVQDLHDRTQSFWDGQGSFKANGHAKNSNAKGIWCWGRWPGYCPRLSLLQQCKRFH